jgi:hypothetical protein
MTKCLNARGQRFRYKKEVPAVQAELEAKNLADRRAAGLIDYNGHIEVHNSLLSAVFHEKPQLNQDI